MSAPRTSRHPHRAFPHTPSPHALEPHLRPRDVHRPRAPNTVPRGRWLCRASEQEKTPALGPRDIVRGRPLMHVKFADDGQVVSSASAPQTSFLGRQRTGHEGLEQAQVVQVLEEQPRRS